MKRLAGWSQLLRTQDTTKTPLLSSLQMLVTTECCMPHIIVVIMHVTIHISFHYQWLSLNIIFMFVLFVFSVLFLILSSQHCLTNKILSSPSTEWWPHCECWQQLATTGEQVNTVGGRDPWPSLCSLSPSSKPWQHFKRVSLYLIYWTH